MEERFIDIIKMQNNEESLYSEEELEMLSIDYLAELLVEVYVEYYTDKP